MKKLLFLLLIAAGAFFLVYNLNKQLQTEMEYLEEETKIQDMNLPKIQFEPKQLESDRPDQIEQFFDSLQDEQSGKG